MTPDFITLYSHRIVRTGVVLATGAVALASCSDELPGSNGLSQSEQISFAVRDNGYAGATGRGSASLPRNKRLSNVVLKSDDGSRLYLSGEEMPWDPVSRTSRAGDQIDDAPDTFGVFASITANDAPYMVNVEVKRDGDVWSPAAEYLWPGDGSLRFSAYAPFRSEASEEGITRIPARDSSGSLTLDYTTPQQLGDMSDLLWAAPVEASSSPCAITMTHALTAVKLVTGSSMTACTVKQVSLSGIVASGTLNTENGSWSDISDRRDYTASPDVTLVAAANSSSAMPGLSLLGDDKLFMMIPQTLGSDAKLSVDIETGGKEYTFTASLAGQVWRGATMIIYRLSASAADNGLILEVTDSQGTPIDTISAPYTGTTTDFRVRSVYSAAGEEEQPVEWDAVYLDEAGNELTAMPDWIEKYPVDGSGDQVMTLITQLPEPQFIEMSDNTQRLRATVDINTISGLSRYNLASSTGEDTDENTANCYIVNAPGKYSIPLVYGNAIKNGTDNKGAYESTVTHTSVHNNTTLYTFINHLGNEITSPYIYDNAGCEPDTAALIWEGRLHMIRNVQLSPDRKSIWFDLPASAIRQGNSLIGVYDSEGRVIWSWHIWVTDMKQEDLFQTVPNPDNDVTYDLYRCSLGRIYGGDITEFRCEPVKVRFTQKNVPDGMEPLTAEIIISQGTETNSTPDCHPFYQWGRKDPMISGLKHFYGPDGSELDGENIPSEPFGTDQRQAIIQGILKPNVFQYSQDLNSLKPFYRNLWNINLANISLAASNPQNLKTVYDPSPVGAKVPLGNVFLALTQYTSAYDESTKMVTVTIPSTGEIVSFTTMGYRTREGGEIQYGSVGSVWCAMSPGTGYGRYLVVNNTKDSNAGSYVSTERHTITIGFGIRPTRE